MNTAEIGWEGLVASLVLVVVAVVLSLAQRLGLERTILWSVARAAVQLLLVGLALAFVLDEDTHMAVAWLWVVGMVLFASFTIRQRAPQGSFFVGFAAIGTVAMVTLGVVFGLGVFPLEARALIPIAGMMIGNAMSESILASRRVVGELGDHRLEVEARLALGMASTDAARPYLREAVRTSIVPQVERTKAVGIVVLPGAMTGLILAGVDPVDAVQVQLAIMYLILGGVVTSVTIVGLGLSRRLFTSDHRLEIPDS